MSRALRADMRESHGQLYIAALLLNLEGIEIAELGWGRKP